MSKNQEKQNNGNGRAFQEKLSLETLEQMILKEKLTTDEILKRSGVQSYTLEKKLHDLSVKHRDNPATAIQFCLSVRPAVNDVVERKRGLNISAALCDLFEIKQGQKYKVEKNKDKIVLTPVK
jgi:hypothetical protein